MARIIVLAAALLLSAAPAFGQITVTGIVLAVDAQGAAVAGAEVSVASAEARTNPQGRFQISGVSRGTHIVRARKIGYLERSVSVDLGASDTIFLTLVLQPTQQTLDTVRVSGARPAPGMQGFYDRKAQGIGTFLGREELDKEQSRELDEVLSRLVGLRVIRLGGGDAAVATSRGMSSVRRQSKGGDASDRARGATSECYSQVIVDGMRLFQPAPGATLFNVNTFQPETVEGIEWYRSAAETPAQYSSLSAECGTLVIWTRRGDPDAVK